MPRRWLRLGPGLMPAIPSPHVALDSFPADGQTIVLHQVFRIRREP